MKRYNNLYQQICSKENLHMAYKLACKGKPEHKGMRDFKANYEVNIEALHFALVNKTYTTGVYTNFPVFDKKERIVSRLPFIDRIVHHALMLIIEPLLTSVFTADTYSCIKGRGTHKASYALRKALRNKAATRYYLQLDIKKFYPSVDHNILKTLLRRKFKDQNLLWLFDNTIDSAPGLPIGNYTSQHFGNFYLCFLDHFIKQELKAKYLFRYLDDYVLLADNKKDLHVLLAAIRTYLKDNLKLTVKGNYKIRPVSEGIDFGGYVHFSHDHVLIRKSIKQAFARMLKANKNPASIAAYKGWLDHCNSRNLVNKLLKEAA